MQRLKLLTIFLFVLIYSPKLVALGAIEPYEPQEQNYSFELPDLTGQIHTLSQMSGKVILVNFWASWCSPCIQEIPSMQRLENALSERPFKILAINVSENKQTIMRRLKRFNITLDILLDLKGNTFKQWQAEIIPTSFIIDKQGHIRYIAKGPVEWDDTEVTTLINKLLKE